MNRSRVPPSGLRAAGYFILAPVVACLATTCGHTCKIPDYPPDGHYRLTNPEDFPITVRSIIVEGNRMTVDYVDESDQTQFVTFALTAY